MGEESVAKLLLAAAKRDQQAFRALVAIPEMNDAVIGFHAHQCIEKALKAALAHAGIAFRRTHAVAELLDLLHDIGRGSPPFSERLDELDPYAVEARYGLVEPFALDREAASRMVEEVVGWAETQLATPVQEGEGPLGRIS
jgi:HEPN domain-containing protein